MAVELILTILILVHKLCSMTVSIKQFYIKSSKIEIVAFQTMRDQAQ